MTTKSLSITLLGRSGCGKGTQAKFLTEYLKTDLYISTGNLLRTLAELPTLAGKKIADQLKMGGLPDAWLVTALWQKELIERLTNIEQNLVFDGAPRRAPEARVLDETMTWFSRSLIIPVLIDITRDEAFKRLKLRGRSDDTDEVINLRLGWYETEVMPVLRYYEDQGRLFKADGMPAPEKVFENILSALKMEK